MLDSCLFRVGKGSCESWQNDDEDDECNEEEGIDDERPTGF